VIKFKKKNRVIILGSKGFIGSNLIKIFEKKENLKTVGISRKEIDFMNENSSKYLSKIINHGDIVVNAIAVAPCKTIMDLNKNVTIIKNIQNGIDKKIYKYVNISSDAIYPDKKSKLNENDIPNPTSVHGLMHLCREKIIDYTSNYNVIHIRPTLVYGFGDPHKGYGPNLFYKTAKEKKIIEIFGSGEEIRDHIYIDDLVYLIAKISFKNFSGPINLVTGLGITFKKIAFLYKNYYKDLRVIKKKRIVKKPHNGYRLFNNQKLRNLFPNFKFMDFEINLKKMIIKCNEENKSS
jgi:nucleoside-diphosphate-sugar epimerase